MDKVKHKLTKLKLSFQHTDNRKTIIIGTVIGIFLAISPYLFYLHESVPDMKIWNTFLFTYESNYYQSANIAMWILTGKIMPLIFLIIWFFTNRNWWYHSLLVPITMYIYQIFGFFSDETKFLDEFQLLYMVPIMAIIIPSIYLIRARMFSQLNDANKSLEELEQEFMIKPTTFWGKIKQYF